MKRLFVLLLPLLMGIAQASSAGVPEAPAPEGEKIGAQYEALPQYPPSQEVNYVEESELARKMNQAKKAENAEKYDSFGGGITIIAMCIVIGALIVLSILFYIFGSISSWVITRKKHQISKIKQKGESEAGKREKQPLDTGDVIAAISAALAQHFATDHDMEDTILTIRKLRKAYSPWNSKIYNMRHLPEVSHNHPKLDNRQ